MKTLKPIMLVVSGMVLAFVFAFKSNSNSLEKEFTTLEIKIGDRKEFLPALNELGKAGWQIKGTYYTTPPFGPPYNTVLLEREKQ
jgi:hypothetical protein